MTPQKTKLQIIEELFDNYYVKQPSKRAAFGAACSYYQESTGNKCAVGMCMLNDETAKHYETVVSTSVKFLNDYLVREEEIELDSIFKEEYRGHGLFFWQSVQNMHDRHYFWTEHGLSEHGIAMLEELKATYT